MIRHLWLLLPVLLTLACAGPPATASASDATLISPEGARTPYHDVLARAPWTVFVFVAAKCPCLDAHKERLAELAKTYGPRGVQFLAVDSEVGSTPESAAREARSQGVHLPVFVDRGAGLAAAFGAEYATYSVIVDRSGRVVYRGGIDSDKRKLHPDATPFVRDALDDVLSGRAPRRATGKTLGCTLRKW